MGPKIKEPTAAKRWALTRLEAYSATCSAGRFSGCPDLIGCPADPLASLLGTLLLLLAGLLTRLLLILVP